MTSRNKIMVEIAQAVSLLFDRRTDNGIGDDV